MDERNPALRMVRGRIALAAAFCALGFSIVGARLVDVMAFGGGEAHASVARQPATAMRADFVDRNGVLVARDLPVSDVYASPSAFWDTGEAARLLAGAVKADASRLAKQFASKKGYVLVQRGITPDQRDAVMRLGLPGLTFEDNFKRYYPAGRAMAHAVGQVDADDNGVSGLELGLDKSVRGAQQPVELSLDARVQFVLAQETAETMKAFRAHAAGGIVLDVRTGEVLALVSLPDYEPNSRVLADTDSPRNRMTQDVYELGSIFKIFAFSQAVERHTVRLDEPIDIGHPYKVGKYQIHDFEGHGKVLTAAMVFAESSNIGTAQIAARSGPLLLKEFLGRMGLLSPLKTELPEMASPLAPRQWGDVEGATVAFGHGISVNPLTFAAAAASVVNGGTRITPTFLKTHKIQDGERLVSEETSRTMRQLMRLVVTEGTGKKADVPGYEIGGKTGTAEKPVNGRYSSKLQISSFCGVFPISHPRYLVFMMVDEPHGNKESFGYSTGGWTAAPAVGRTIARIAPLLDVPKVDVVADAADEP